MSSLGVRNILARGMLRLRSLVNERVSLMVVVLDVDDAAIDSVSSASMTSVANSRFTAAAARAPADEGMSSAGSVVVQL